MRYQEHHSRIVEICTTALTLSEVETRLGITSPSGALRRYVKTQKIPMPCYQGSRASLRRAVRRSPVTTAADLCVNSRSNTGTIKSYLLRNSLKTTACEVCGWNQKRVVDGAVPTELHHVNGDTSDNRIDNLQILCPNCHALTGNYRGKNKSEKRAAQFTERKAFYAAPQTACQQCGLLTYAKKFCSSACMGVHIRRVEWPNAVQLQADIDTLTWEAIGRKYGVSSSSVRKWARHLGLLT